MKPVFDATRALPRVAHLIRWGHAGESLPLTGQVSIEDIAHILASTCCFGGRARHFYSIAQHGFLASTIVPPEDALAALLLNAGEALKQLIPACLDMEGQATADVLADLGRPPFLPPAVKYADLVLRATERRDLEPPSDDAWTGAAPASPLARTIQPFAPVVAKHLFIERYQELRHGASSQASASRQADH